MILLWTEQFITDFLCTVYTCSSYGGSLGPFHFQHFQTGNNCFSYPEIAVFTISELDITDFVIFDLYSILSRYQIMFQVAMAGASPCVDMHNFVQVICSAIFAVAVSRPSLCRLCRSNCQCLFIRFCCADDFVIYI